MTKVQWIYNINHNVNSIHFLGDVHGNMSHIAYTIRSSKWENCIIFQVGDFGAGFISNESYIALNKELKSKNIWLYAIRGNHDLPEAFNNQFEESNIFMVKDYTILNMIIGDQEKNIFCLGGAISIDRLQRIPNKSWWENEVVDFNYTDEDIEAINNINIIVSHTSPDWLPPTKMGKIVYHFAANDPSLLHDLVTERANMTVFMNQVIANNKDTLHDYYYGHFHYNQIFKHENVNYNLLGVGEFKRGD